MRIIQCTSLTQTPTQSPEKLVQRFRFTWHLLKQPSLCSYIRTRRMSSIARVRTARLCERACTLVMLANDARDTRASESTRCGVKCYSIFITKLLFLALSFIDSLSLSLIGRDGNRFNQGALRCFDWFLNFNRLYRDLSKSF